MCLHGAGRKNVGEGKLKPLVFLLEFLVMGCLNLSVVISFGIKHGLYCQSYRAGGSSDGFFSAVFSCGGVTDKLRILRKNYSGQLV